jgi:hypothetical protein
VRNHDRLAAFHDGDNRVRGAQIDADNLAHSVTSRVFVRQMPVVSRGKG